MLDEDLNSIAAFLARRDVSELSLSHLGRGADAIVLLGSSLIGPARTTASAFHAGCAPKVLISGGIGHSTPGLWLAVKFHPEFGALEVDGRPEAEILNDILVLLGVPAEAILLESRSTNCGANATDSFQLIGSLKRMILIQDPTMQRRTHASFERAWKGTGAEFVSFAPFIPAVRGGGLALEPDGRWSFDRFVSLVLGEICRLRDDEDGYGPRGKNYIDHVEMPKAVLEAFERAAAQFPEALRPPT